MDWNDLLSAQRLCRPELPAPAVGRSPFQQDADRVVFSSAFRRLQDKTQVHPLSENDHVRTRLTHSVEVSSVGRSLGTIVGTHVKAKHSSIAVTADEFGYIVQAACLAHDIGNPPFGHCGEGAISEWFKRNAGSSGSVKEGLTAAQVLDFEKFEGNAQGFRILTALENNRRGGLQLTYATLGTFTKYPRASDVTVAPDDQHAGRKKHGFFEAERPYFEEVAQALGLRRFNPAKPYWCRHPLCYLVEAADDICFRIVDIEDGYELKLLSFDEAKQILQAIANLSQEQLSDWREPELIRYLRAKAIGELVNAAATAFCDHHDDLLSGNFDGDLLSKTKFSDALECAKKTAVEKVFGSRGVVQVELAGFEVIGGLLDIFCEAILGLEGVAWDHSKLRPRPQRVLSLLGHRLQNARGRYEGLLIATDYIAGMTDSFAIALYRKLKGISL
jgi:dGTPase